MSAQLESVKRAEARYQAVTKMAEMAALKDSLKVQLFWSRIIEKRNVG